MPNRPLPPRPSGDDRRGLWRPDDTRTHRFELVVILVVIGILAYELRTGAAALYGYVRDRAIGHMVEGRVVDVTTGAGISGVGVTISSLGAHLFDPDPLGGTTQTSGLTSDSGEFRIRARVGTNTSIHFHGAGYVSSDAFPRKLDALHFAMVPVTARKYEVGEDEIELLGQPKRVHARIDLEGLKAVGEEDSCDVILTSQGIDADTLRLDAAGGASLEFIVGDDRSTGTPDSFANGCTAPDTGYAASATVPVVSPPGVCFVRTRRGRRYGSIGLDTGQFLAVVRDSSRAGHVPVRLRLNRSGKRGLCTESMF